MHINGNALTEDRVPDHWLAATAQLTAEVSSIAPRIGYLHCKVGPNMAQASGTAEFHPRTSTLQFNSRRLLPSLDPDEFDLSDPLFLERHQGFVGAFGHELGHALVSFITPAELAAAGLSPNEIEVLVALEEPRVEHEMLTTYKNTTVTKNALGQMALKIVASDFAPRNDHYAMGIAVALLVMRGETGVLTPTETAKFRAGVEEVLTPDCVDRLVVIGRKYLTMYHLRPKMRAYYVDADLAEYCDKLQKLAREWLDVIREAEAEAAAAVAAKLATGADAEEDDKPEDEAKSESIAERDADDRAEDVPGASDDARPSYDPVLDVHDDGTSHGTGTHGRNDKSTGEGTLFDDLVQKSLTARDRARVRRVKALKVKRAAAARAELNGRIRARREEHRMAWNAGAKARVERRTVVSAPTGKQRRAAVLFRKTLEKAMSPDLSVEHAPSRAPGGTLRSHAAVQRAALLAQGLPTDEVKPWRVKEVTDRGTDPVLKIGMLVDVSGSMSHYAGPAASISYIVGQAATSMGEQYAAVAFGAGAYGLVKNGQRVTEIRKMAALESTESIRAGMLALDEELDFITPDDDSIRVVFVLTDGVFVDQPESQWADRMFPEIVARGTVLIHVNLADDTYTADSHRHNNPIPVLHLSSRTTDTEVAAALGEVVVAEVARRFRSED
jgi:hypothetical protein